MAAEMNMHSNAPSVRDKLQRAVERYLTEAGMHLEGQAKKALEHDPRRVDTGLLRNSITFALAGESPSVATYHADYGENINKRTGKRYKAGTKRAGSVEIGFYNGTAPTEKGPHTVYVGTNVEYAIYVHEGTYKMDPNRFIKNAFEANYLQLEKMAQKIIKEELT